MKVSVMLCIGAILCILFFSPSLRAADEQHCSEILRMNGPEAVVSTIRKLRNGSITVEVNSTLRHTVGLPDFAYITARSVCADIEHTGLTVEQFAVQAKAREQSLVQDAEKKEAEYHRNRRRAEAAAQQSPTSGVSGTADEKIALTIKTALHMRQHNVHTVQVIDGRAKGGEKILLISYVAKPGTEAAQLGELMTISTAGEIANTQLKAAIDSIGVIVGDTHGRTLAVIAVKNEAAEQFVRTHDGTSYLKTWTMTVRDPQFLSNTAKLFRW